ncbi:MAG: DUF3306 domain-containing protein [Sulfuritalea sp.]|jgi:hypothetical protein|nr:DUF3306 domain-containing protein [Sulfuritalea sp.]
MIAGQGENFFSRWARLKQRGEPMPASAATPANAVPLPDPATMSFEDDFTGFLRQEVEERLKRVALKKLFHSAEFNVMDGLDTYIDDYSLPDPIDEATLRSLVQAKGLLFDDASPAVAVAAPAETAPAADAADAAEDDVQAAAEGSTNVG